MKKKVRTRCYGKCNGGWDGDDKNIIAQSSYIHGLSQWRPKETATYGLWMRWDSRKGLAAIQFRKGLPSSRDCHCFLYWGPESSLIPWPGLDLNRQTTIKAGCCLLILYSSSWKLDMPQTEPFFCLSFLSSIISFHFPLPLPRLAVPSGMPPLPESFYRAFWNFHAIVNKRLPALLTESLSVLNSSLTFAQAQLLHKNSGMDAYF